MAQVDLALIHYPVLNKNKEIIGAAVTNLDIHDIARAGRTYGVGSFYIVTPYEDQQQLVQEIVSHWRSGYGATYNSDRKEALGGVHVCTDLQALYEQIAVDGKRPVVLATSAQSSECTMWTYSQVKERINQGERILVLFGTAWGLASEVMAEVDAVLPPISGGGDYNHLSVRSAVSIVLDRLLSVDRG
ncbi:MAG: RNA methyltransferase [Desulfobulbaceae bacterium]|uniref:RNA methyltransferase n=1 Tax=Candidatus Desulfobia pelagia TaxID=2841692 RepID=A0A8J6NAC5_9BACT|nr:RNA methyltransferase [Candidatus Desulfobia pelagia]